MIWLNKNDNKKQTSRSFSILFSVMGNLEIVMGSSEIFSDFYSALSRNYLEIYYSILKVS